MYALAIHGGAGPAAAAPHETDRQALRIGLARALRAGERVLAAGGAALDAVGAAVTVLEDDASFNAAHGAVLCADGSVELDAAIMDGTTLRAGAVALLRQTRNPVQLARRVLESLPHVFLAGPAADQFAAECALAQVGNDYFITAARREQWQRWRAAACAPTDAPQPFGISGTVGAVARDRQGHLAAATSTGGRLGKRRGRIGDSPVIGAGTYANDGCCAVSMTGHGEWFLRTVAAYDLAARLSYLHQPLGLAVDAQLAHLTCLDARGGLIAVDPSGHICTGHNTGVLLYATVREGQAAEIAID
jgi:beta-aspartyl-peptidase (threonine type)